MKCFREPFAILSCQTLLRFDLVLGALDFGFTQAFIDVVNVVVKTEANVGGEAELAQALADRICERFFWASKSVLMPNRFCVMKGVCP